MARRNKANSVHATLRLTLPTGAASVGLPDWMALCWARKRYLWKRDQQLLVGKDSKSLRTLVRDRSSGNLDEIHHRLLVRDTPPRLLRVIVDWNDSVVL
jgi:hypothetical protein